MTFVLNQSQIHIKYHFDLDADQTGGAFTKKTTKFDTMNMNLMIRRFDLQ